MEIQEQRQGAVIVLKPQGPLTKESAEQVKHALSDALGRNLGRVVLDAAAISFVDSVGLEVLADVSEELSQGGQALKLCSANETLREVLDLTDLAALFEQFADANSAVRSFL